MNQRSSYKDMVENPWINDQAVKGLQNLKSIETQEPKQQKTFLSELTKLIPQYTPKLIQENLLPFITNSLENEQFQKELICMLLYILERKIFPKKSDQKIHIWPIFLKIISGKNIKGQSLYLIIVYINLLIEMLSKDEISDKILKLF